MQELHIPMNWQIITAGVVFVFGVGTVIWTEKRHGCDIKEIKTDMKEKVECEDCNKTHEGVCKKLTVIQEDTKENTKILHEIIGELKHINGKA